MSIEGLRQSPGLSPTLLTDTTPGIRDTTPGIINTTPVLRCETPAVRVITKPESKTVVRPSSHDVRDLEYQINTRHPSRK